MPQPDILLIMSDQHQGRVAGFAGDTLIHTPALDRIAAAGTAFTAAYTPCPLCAPARMAFLSGRLPIRDGLYGNEQALRSDRATFLHALTARGYETVLCGRMHFNGPDQRHGFQRRIFGDITGVTPEVFGRYFGSLGYPRAVEDGLFGGGDSPVLAYDRSVAQAAVDYFDDDHAAPQCLVVGTYGPHSPFVAPPERYAYYRNRVPLPASTLTSPNHRHPALRYAYRRYDDDTVRQVRAAYYGMVEEQDALIGQIYDAWQAYLQRMGRPGVFVYTSDHGEQMGEHDLYTKMALFDGSTRIPLLIAGEGIPENRAVAAPVSLLDIGPTLLEMTGAPALPDADGQSLASMLDGRQEDTERSVISEIAHLPLGPVTDAPAHVIRHGPWKLLVRDGEEDCGRLIHDETDILGIQDRRAEYPEIARCLRQVLDGRYLPVEYADAFTDVEPSAPRKLEGSYLACRELPYCATTDGYGRMIRRGPWKLISYAGFPEEDLLFNLESDPWELTNVRESCQEIVKELSALLWQGVDIEALYARLAIDQQHSQLVAAVPAAIPPDEYWAAPPDALKPPICR